MTRNFMVLLASLAVMAGAPADAQEEAAVAAAEAATLEWLTLADASRYSDSWQASSSLFRAAVSPEEWAASLERARAPFGALRSRDQAGYQYSTTLPGAPDGEYVVFQFHASFENKAAAVETVTAMKDEDGQWRVSGYFIR